MSTKDDMRWWCPRCAFTKDTYCGKNSGVYCREHQCRVQLRRYVPIKKPRASKITREVLLEQRCTVTIDRSKFTPEFMAEFREAFYPFNMVEDHIEHLGQLHMRGLARNHGFIEGYGLSDSMGISFSGTITTAIDVIGKPVRRRVRP